MRVKILTKNCDTRLKYEGDVVCQNNEFIVIQGRYSKDIFRKDMVDISVTPHFSVGDYVHIKMEDNSFQNHLFQVTAINGHVISLNGVGNYYSKRCIEYSFLDVDFKVVPLEIALAFMNKS